ncbi:hypothetical protein MKZ38_000974 [Zalerion maritima]|uniref:EXPERA domain-containing protein n=1 Tax=Zalerion maritima TaxID=339359 RepID=A0AAD5RQV6_9PEZI|nr:hypothetical protein MKZ38_000974 [Zalerion maritima]
MASSSTDAAPSKSWLDYVYLVYFALQPPIILLIDCVPLVYPSSLYRSPSSPLHFLQSLRTFYATQFGDQFFAREEPERWFAMFGYQELLFHLPIALWAVSSLSGLRGGAGAKERLPGKTELVLLCYALQTAVTTATCIYEVLGWYEGPEGKPEEEELAEGGNETLVTTKEQKMLLVWGLYGPYLALRELAFPLASIFGLITNSLWDDLAMVMLIDMFTRLSRRFEMAEEGKGEKKTQ